MTNKTTENYQINFLNNDKSIFEKLYMSIFCSIHGFLRALHAIFTMLLIASKLLIKKTIEKVFRINPDNETENLEQFRLAKEELARNFLPFIECIFTIGLCKILSATGILSLHPALMVLGCMVFMTSICFSIRYTYKYNKLDELGVNLQNVYQGKNISKIADLELNDQVTYVRENNKKQNLFIRFLNRILHIFNQNFIFTIIEKLFAKFNIKIQLNDWMHYKNQKINFTISIYNFANCPREVHAFDKIINRCDNKVPSYPEIVAEIILTPLRFTQSLLELISSGIHLVKCLPALYFKYRGNNNYKNYESNLHSAGAVFANGFYKFAFSALMFIPIPFIIFPIPLPPLFFPLLSIGLVVSKIGYEHVVEDQTTIVRFYDSCYQHLELLEGVIVSAHAASEKGRKSCCSSQPPLQTESAHKTHFPDISTKDILQTPNTKIPTPDNKIPPTKRGTCCNSNKKREEPSAINTSDSLKDTLPKNGEAVKKLLISTQDTLSPAAHTPL